MAIHTDYPGLKVEIFVDGKSLEEYENEEEEEEEEENESKITTRYVECRSGAEFEIRTSFDPPFTPLDIAISSYLDGTLTEGMFAKKKAMLTTVYTQSEIKWGTDGSWRASKFRFSDLSIVEEDRCVTFEESSESSSAVGTISIVLTEALRHRIVPKATKRKRMFREVGPVSESSMKGDTRSHMISVAPDRAIEAPTRAKLKLAAEPLVTFRFKYRSITALKSLGMIPRSPSPSPVPRPKSIKKHDPPESSRDMPPNTISSSATPRLTASITPTPRQQKSASPPFNEHDGLTNEDIIALIKHYRGNDKGLVDQNRKHLLVLLKHYVDKDNEIIPIKQESAPSESSVRNKREHIDDGAVRGQGKRRKPEVIVLDD